MNVAWGMFGPDHVASQRRLQTLGLGSAIRHYNEKSVPGLGGRWFGMPMIWSLLGIDLAASFRKRPLPVATAIEAAVMVQALGKNVERSRGNRKLARFSEPVFKTLAVPGTYVSQPYRMGTVEPLYRLGFVEGAAQRFNLYQLAAAGTELLKPYQRQRRQLSKWIEDAPLRTLLGIAPNDRLDPISASLMTRQLRDHGESLRRRALLDLRPDQQGRSPLGRECPRGMAPDHWADLRSGIALVRLRESAIRLLGRIESMIGLVSGTTATIDDALDSTIREFRDLTEAAAIMLKENDSDRDGQAHAFARECQAEDPRAVIRYLAQRDGVVIRLLQSGRLALGPAGGTGPPLVEPADQAPDDNGWAPELPRIANLFALDGDLLAGRSLA